MLHELYLRPALSLPVNLIGGTPRRVPGRSQVKKGSVFPQFTVVKAPRKAPAGMAGHFIPCSAISKTLPTFFDPTGKVVAN